MNLLKSRNSLKLEGESKQGNKPQELTEVGWLDRIKMGS